MALRFFLPITKIDKKARMVFGYASTPTKDLQGEVVSLDALKEALPDYMEWRNIREMHQAKAVGVAKEASIDERGLYVGAKIVDDECWAKCVPDEDGDAVLQGFSIGGEKLMKDGDTITALKLIEISLVDRPANPDCRISVAKAAGYAADGLQAPAPRTDANHPQHAPLTPEADEPLREPRRLRPTPTQTGGVEDREGGEDVDKVEEREDVSEADKQRATEQYGDVAYADAKNKKYPIDTEAHIRAAWNYVNQPKNAKKYSAKDLATIKAKIIAAWKRTIDQDGPPSAREKAALVKVWEARLQDVRAGMAKGLYCLSALATAFEAIRQAQRDILYEAAAEEDPEDQAIAEQLGAIASELADCMADKAKHEATEATALTDQGDQFLPQNRPTPGGAIQAAQGRNQEEEIMDLSKSGLASHIQEHLKKGHDHFTKGHDAHQKGMASMAKALEKMGKKAKKGQSVGGEEEPGPDGQNAAVAGEIQEHVQKAASHFGKAADHFEMAEHHLGKVHKHVFVSDGGDGDDDEDEDGDEHDGNKVARGHMTKAQIAELIQAKEEAAYLKGQVSVLNNQPALREAGKSPALFAVDRNVAQVGGAPTDPNAVLFKGIDLTRLDTKDPSQREAASRRAIGNMVVATLTGEHAFGKSILSDSSFHGSAGGNQ